MITVEEVTVIQAPIERCFDLARSVEAHLAGNVHWGESASVIDGVTSGLVGLGERVTWRARHFGFRHCLTSEITVMTAPVYFQDVQVRGPFRFMRHDHFFEAISPDRTVMKDIFSFAGPLPLLGRIAEVLLLRSHMQCLLRERNIVLQRIAESDDWRRYLIPRRA